MTDKLDKIANVALGISAVLLFIIGAKKILLIPESGPISIGIAQGEILVEGIFYAVAGIVLGILIKIRINRSKKRP